jgi:hypothetical protein
VKWCWCVLVWKSHTGALAEIGTVPIHESGVLAIQGR